MKWREGDGGPTLRTAFGRLVARVNHTGTLWRGTVWTAKGTSSFTANTLADAMFWCEEELSQ